MARKARKSVIGTADPKLDMSPMIDLVFLLLIFFMIASTMITFKKDPKVVIPIASASIKAKLVLHRVIINIYEDGSIGDVNSNPMTLDELEQRMSQMKGKHADTKLHLRSDQRVAHKAVKEVIAASARGGVSEVIFSTYVRP